MGKRIINLSDDFDKALQELAVEFRTTPSTMAENLIIDYLRYRHTRRVDILCSLPHECKVALINYINNENYNEDDLDFVESILR